MKCINCYSDIKSNKCPYCGEVQIKEVQVVTKNKNENFMKVIILLVVPLFLSLLGFVHFIVAFIGIILSIFSFSYFYKLKKEDLINKRYYSIICVFALVISSIFFIGSIDEIQVRRNMSKKIGNELNIKLIDEKPTESSFSYNPENDKVVGIYYYDLNDANISFMNESVKNLWSFGRLTESESKFLKRFIEIKQSVLDNDEGYHLIYNRKTNKFSVPTNSLNYDFVYIYYNPNKVDNFNLYIYDIKN